MATLAPAATEPVTSDYVRVRRQMTTTFLWVDPADTAADLKAKIHKITKVPAGDIKLFIDKTGDVVLDETKSLADQKARRAPMPPFPQWLCQAMRFAWCVLPQVDNDQELFMVYRKEGACPVPRPLLKWIRHASARSASAPSSRHHLHLPPLPTIPAQEERANGRRSRSGCPPRLRVWQADVPCVLQWYCGGR